MRYAKVIIDLERVATIFDSSDLPLPGAVWDFRFSKPLYAGSVQFGANAIRCQEGLRSALGINVPIVRGAKNS